MAPEKGDWSIRSGNPAKKWGNHLIGDSQTISDSLEESLADTGQMQAALDRIPGARFMLQDLIKGIHAIRFHGHPTGWADSRTFPLHDKE